MASTMEPPRIPTPPIVKDAFYTAVGVAVLASQRLQVKRRELQKQLEPGVKSAAGVTRERIDDRRRDLRKQLEPTVRNAAGRLRDAAGALDERVDPVLDQVEQRLPAAGGDLLRQARGAAKEVRDTVLDLAAGRKDQITER